MSPDFYRRKLPHLQPAGGTFFVTYRLHNSLPVSQKLQLQEEYRLAKERLARSCTPERTMDELNRSYFGRFDKLLDLAHYSPTFLQIESVAHIVADSLHFWDNKRIELIAFCVMPNHVHAAFTLLAISPNFKKVNSLQSVLHSVKSFSAHKANELLGLDGPFWEEESYDRLVRNDEELRRIVRYILNNPVKAGLCNDWKQWKWNYVKPIFDEFSEN